MYACGVKGLLGLRLRLGDFCLNGCIVIFFDRLFVCYNSGDNVDVVQRL